MSQKYLVKCEPAEGHCEEPKAVARHSRSKLGAGRSKHPRDMFSINEQEIPRCARNRLRNLFDLVENAQF